MKSLRGFTFIEVLIALAVISILLPVVGIVFYNLFVIPPDQGTRLKLNNEVAMLSSMLYNDGHLAENFSLGAFPLSPYYGNFTWTDYSVTPPQQYLVSYYATCPNVSNTSCRNQIVRHVSQGNASILPMPTPAPTPPSVKIIPGRIEAEDYTSMYGIQTENTSDPAGGILNVGWTDAGDWMDYSVDVQTAGEYNIEFRMAGMSPGILELEEGGNLLCSVNTPNTGGWQTWTTVTATATLSSGAKTLRISVITAGWNLNWITFSPVVPTTEKYEYCIGGGTNRWAWAKAWNNSEWFVSPFHPTSPDDFIADTYGRTIVPAEPASYNQICNSDDSSWGNQDTTPPLNYGVSSQLFTIGVNQNRSLVNNLSVEWRGYGGDLTYNTKLKIYNYTTGSWTTLNSSSDPGSKVIYTYVNNISGSSAQNYIDTSSGYVSLLASSDINNETPTDINFGKALLFNGVNNSVTTSPAVPTNTFTFEAWVKATEEITMYSQATSGAAGCIGQHYVFWPTYGGDFDAGVGLSVGTNGISVYEHGNGYLPPLAAYTGSVGTAWNHIAVVYSSDVANIYLNGNPVKTGLASTKGIAYAPNIIGYGADWGAGSSNFSGSIDEVRVWNVARTQAEIRANMYQEITSPTANLTGYWKFNDNVSDSSGYGNNGTLSTPAPEYVGSVQRDLTVYTDYIALTVITPGAEPGPSPTIAPLPTPTATTVPFTSVGPTTWTPLDGVSSVRVLVVGGGGGGGGSGIAQYCGGGGGGGGVQYNAAYDVTAGIPINVVVGDKGTGGYDNGASTSGTQSQFGSIIANGGGGGGSGPDFCGQCIGITGASGGGGGVRGTAYTGGSGTQGYAGGAGYYAGWLYSYRNAAGGGGGANQLGANGLANAGGKGGNGLNYWGTFGAVGGDSGYFGGGGGGGVASGGTGGAGGDGCGPGTAGKGGDNTNGNSASDNTGGGGGGSGGNDKRGGNGGTGYVIVNYSISWKHLWTSESTGGTVTPKSPGQNYYTNEVVDIVATAAKCYRFTEWTGTGVTDNKVLDRYNPSTTISMTANYSVRANFVQNTDNYYLSLNASPADGGSPTFLGSNPFSCGFVVPIFANPEPGFNFSRWDPSSGVANYSAADTTVQMTQNRSPLTAIFTNSSLPAPSPTPINKLTTMYLTWHITADNFSLKYQKADNYIIANMTAGVNTNMGKYIEKQLTIFISPRQLYLLPEENIWGEDPISTLSSFCISGTDTTISGDLKVNGTVTVASTALRNRIDGDLTCPNISGDNQAKLAYNIPRITGYPKNVMPDIGKITDYITTTNLTTGTVDWVQADVIHEYVFTGNVSLHTVNAVWQGNNPEYNHTLKTGTYYSPGTITLDDSRTRGTVTFLAGNKIIINNDDSSTTYDTSRKIALGPYSEDLLLWANGSTGSTGTALDGDIRITGSSTGHACVTLEGVLFAPNGEIELAGSGMNRLFYINRAELYRSALIAKNLTISGSYWNIFRW